MARYEKQHSEEGMTLPFMQLNGSFEAAVKRGKESFEAGLKALQEESLQFLSRRLEHTGASVEQSHQCENFTDLLSVQQKWMTDLARDYYDETIRLGGVMQKWMQEAAGFSEEIKEKASGKGSSNPQ